MRLLLTGGGTGGHVYPALAIAEALREDAAFAPLDVLFVGTRNGLEASIVPSAGLPAVFVAAAPLPRKPSPALVRTLFANLAGFFQAVRALGRFRPDVAVATGGYVALPVVAALRFLRAIGRSRAKVALLEANAVPGLTNRLLEPLVDEIWLTVREPAASLGGKSVVTGTPVRASMLRPLGQAEARLALGLDPRKTTIIVMGGSQGARTINEAVVNLVTGHDLPADWQILHVSGARDFPALRERESLARSPGIVHLVEYLEDPRTAYAAADLAVTRSGASTLGELAATRTPALLVPFPFATADHQTRNATAFARGGAAYVVADREFDADRLLRELQALLQPERLAAMRAAAHEVGGDPRAAVRERVKRWLPTKNSNS